MECRIEVTRGISHRLLLATAILFAIAPAIAGNKPKLVLQVTVDQLRGDLPTRYYDRLGEGGLRFYWIKA